MIQAAEELGVRTWASQRRVACWTCPGAACTGRARRGGVCEFPLSPPAMNDTSN